VPPNKKKKKERKIKETAKLVTLLEDQWSKTCYNILLKVEHRLLHLKPATTKKEIQYQYSYDSGAIYFRLGNIPLTSSPANTENCQL
jgi:hypothetical protein